MESGRGGFESRLCLLTRESGTSELLLLGFRISKQGWKESFHYLGKCLGTALWQLPDKHWCRWNQGSPRADPSGGLTSEPWDPAPECLHRCCSQPGHALQSTHFAQVLSQGRGGALGWLSCTATLGTPVLGACAQEPGFRSWPGLGLDPVPASRHEQLLCLGLFPGLLLSWASQEVGDVHRG